MDFLGMFALYFILLMYANGNRCTGTRNAIQDDATLYVYNGDDARDGEFPWMVMIANYQGLLHCGAALISPRHVLTAGHCTIGMPVENPPMIAVVLGLVNMLDIGSAQMVAHVTRIIRHPSYKPAYKFDFAILELDRYVSFSSEIQPICPLPPRINLDGENAVVTGWGFSEPNSLSNILQKATIPIWNWQECRRLYESHGNYDLSQVMLCAGDTRNGKDACTYDSGGPLAWQHQSGRWFLVGIVSWGAECGGDLPGVYSNVSSVQNWITNQTNYSCTSTDKTTPLSQRRVFRKNTRR